MLHSYYNMVTIQLNLSKVRAISLVAEL